MKCFLTIVFLASAFISPNIIAQDVQQSIESIPVVAAADVTAVTVYRGRASVTRTAELALNPGLYEVRFESLPNALQIDSLQARITGSAKVLGVDFEQKRVAKSTSKEVAALDQKIELKQQEINELEDQLGLVDSQMKFIEAVTIRATDDASKQGGTAELDLEAVRNQFEFVSEQRRTLLASNRNLQQTKQNLQKQLQVLQAKRNSIAGSSFITRTAVISLVVLEASQTTLDLVYLVHQANWQPQYNVRASADDSSVTVEYDAMISQRTGEDWNDVELTLSTAQPTIAANPPALNPWYVDVQQPPAPISMARKAPRRAKSADFTGMLITAGIAPALDANSALNQFAELAFSAEVAGSGPSVTYHLPRLITVKTSSEKQQRTRITSINTHAKFTHVAMPVLTEAVYVRGEMINDSEYQLLPGKASIFFGQDFVGPTQLSSIAPQGKFKLHFGIDQSVTATRKLVSKKTGGRGMFSSGQRITYQYRLAISNGAGKPLTVEMWDRYPVSRNEKIKVSLVDLSRALATDEEFITQQQPQGLLKWTLEVPSDARGDNALITTYTTKIEWPKDVNPTALPD